MVFYNSNKNEMSVVIPATDISELNHYKRGLIGILAEVTINECSEDLKENIKSVYRLLDHLDIDQTASANPNHT